MAEYIPVAPRSLAEPPEEPPAPPPPEEDEPTAPSAPTQRRKVLDQSQLSGAGFDEDILTDIERRLDSESAPQAAKPATEKVELDKADLPLLDALIPPPAGEAPAEVEVDLAGEGEADFEVPSAELEPEAAPGRRKLIIAGGVAVLALAVGLTLWFTLLQPKKQVTVVESANRLVQDKIPDPRLALRLDLEPFLVPLVNAKQGQLLMVGVSLEVSDEADKEVLIPYKTQIRDAIYRLLRDRPAEEVQNARAKNLLQTQIKTELNHLLGQGIIYQVFFTDFAITG